MATEMTITELIAEQITILRKVIKDAETHKEWRLVIDASGTISKFLTSQIEINKLNHKKSKVTKS